MYYNPSLRHIKGPPAPKPQLPTHCRGIKDATQKPSSSVITMDHEEEKTTADSHCESLKTSLRNVFTDVVSKLKMEPYIKSKLSPKDILSIGKESVMNIELKNFEDMPWYFLHKVMAVDSTARNTTINQPLFREGEGASWYENQFQTLEPTTQHSIHPLDVICAVLHSSDNFLQQEIMSKMAMCQFAVPLILPPSQDQECTFLLWALRGIVKRWRPHSLVESNGFVEDNLVNIKMPTISFVRLGECNISKSRILNHLLCQTQSYYDIFVNQDMVCGNTEKTIADGLVEISWLFPGSVNKSELFSEPAAIINLRGDLASYWKQFTFLTHVSSAVFIFTKYFSEKEYELFLNCKNNNTDYYFIIDSQNDIETKKILEILKELSKVLTVHVLKSHHRNVTELVRTIQHNVVKYIPRVETRLSLQDQAVVATKLGIHVDENSTECQKAKTHADLITNDINNVLEYKKKTMPLQGDLWKELSKTEKELCRMKHQGNININIYKRQLERKCSELHRAQYQHELPSGIRNYMISLMALSTMEIHYFLGWMKLYLDAITRNNLSALQAEYKEKCGKWSTNSSEVNRLCEKISDGSLGIDHFLRELGQFFEAECAMIKIQPNVEIKYKKLPKIAADLLLNGYPIELIDGDASNIPLQWVTNVLKELNKKTKGRCRMRVISVLGVQSTGKSTLLNTMFGLQFPVASGRCTRGAFMTLIKVKENLQKEMDCDFILVIDTEGLKAPEMASLEDSYEHDNELATLVVGLSDITIVNIAMENLAEMKDILQIVVHAFLRMKNFGKKSNCFFVHQNVNDVSAYLNNRINRNTFLNELNDMAKVAAKMEKIDAPKIFSDIMNYDPEKHSWYIPGLWHGVPPMAPINLGYSENVFKLRKYLFEFIKESQDSGPHNIDSFTKWLNSLWNAVKYESFIFNFRNTLVAEAYEQLSTKYSELQWNFRKRVYSWLTEQENIIKNQPQSKLKCVTTEILQNETTKLLDREEANMTKQLKLFFDRSFSKMYVAERYRADFMSYVKCLRVNMEVIISSKCWEAVKIQKGKHEVHNIQESCLQLIEEKVSIHLKNQSKIAHDISNTGLKREFDLMWDQILQEQQVCRLRKHNIDSEILEHFKKEMTNRGSIVMEMLHNVTSLKHYGQNAFKMDKTYINIPSLSTKVKEFFTNNCYKSIANVAKFLEHMCQNYVTDRLIIGEDYNEIYCQELLNIINQKLNQEEVRQFHPSVMFEVNLKLHILGAAAPQFQKMHNDFGFKNDPRLLINRFKPQYFEIFKNKLKQKDESNARAKDFCDQCLKPAITDHIYKNLGQVIIDDMLKDPINNRFNNQKHFHFRILKELLEMNNFENYAEYISNYEMYLKTWIAKYIVKKYKNSSGLDVLIKKMISSVAGKIQNALNDKHVQKSHNVLEFFEFFQKNLMKHLVVSNNAIKVIVFQNTVDIHQFISNIKFHVEKCQEEIRLEMKHLRTESLLNRLSLKPEDELLKIMLGCWKKCLFCNAPCEARGDNHQEHFASAHRPRGLAQHVSENNFSLCTTICSTAIISNDTFRNPHKQGKKHPFRGYRSVYTQWIIQPEINSKSSLYWKFVLTRFNYEFANLYQANPAEIPEEWLKITQTQALRSLKDIYNIK